MSEQSNSLLKVPRALERLEEALEMVKTENEAGLLSRLQAIEILFFGSVQDGAFIERLTTLMQMIN